MQKDWQELPSRGAAEMVQKASGKQELKNQNPNQNHNTKKESLGPNTKR